MKRLATFALALLAALAPLSPAAAGTPAYERLRGLFAAAAEERRAAADLLLARPDRGLVAGIVDALFFLPKEHRDEAFDVLEGLAGERPGRRYQDWIELVGRRRDLLPRAGYTEWKAELFARIDPRYRQVFYAQAPARIRLEEIVSGGVRFEGIPALDRPPHVPAAAAGQLAGPLNGSLNDGERVFGVSSGGEQRAYPLRYLDWHEMANDVVGGRPVTLSYCTLCGSGVLFDTRNPGGAPYTFGSSGLLYRSNKLMVDRQTLSLWSNLTGEPAVGRLAEGPPGSIRLPILPLTLTTWKDWRTRHPATTVVVLDPASGRRWGYEYVPGAADRKRAGVRFPVPAKSVALGEREPVFALRLGERARVYPVAKLMAAGVLNDAVGQEAVVLVADPESGAVRAYGRGAHTFDRRGGEGATAGGGLQDETGRRWRVDEEALVPLADDPHPGDSGGTGGPAVEAALPRLPGHQAFWFGWYAAFPDSELYGGGS